MEYLNGYGMAYYYDVFVLTVPVDDYTGATLAPGIQDLLNGFAATFDFEVLHHPARGLSQLKQNLKGWVLITNLYTQ